jgi:hypothetical protein
MEENISLTAKRFEMGAGVSVANSNSRQEAFSNLSQQVAQQCTTAATCTIANITIVGDQITGNIVFNQLCSGTAQCLMTTSANAIANLMLNAVQNTTAQRDFTLFGTQVNVASSDSFTSVSQEVQQLVSSACNANTNALLANIQIIATNTISGNLTFNQNASPLASCIMNLSAQAYSNIAISSNQQTASGQTINALIIIIAIVVVIVLAIIFFAVGASANSKGNTCKQGAYS